MCSWSWRSSGAFHYGSLHVGTGHHRRVQDDKDVPVRVPGISQRVLSGTYASGLGRQLHRRYLRLSGYVDVRPHWSLRNEMVCRYDWWFYRIGCIVQLSAITGPDSETAVCRPGQSGLPRRLERSNDERSGHQRCHRIMSAIASQLRVVPLAS